MMAHGKTESRLTCAGQAAHLGADYSITGYTYDDFGRLVLAVTAEGGIQKNCYDAEGLRTEMEENGILVDVQNMD